jgi:hypothetical protein
MRTFTKIFGIGLSRTGTHSLTAALRQFGVTAIHFPATFADVEAHDAATDSTIADQFEMLDETFPGSLFILTMRELESWLGSCERFWAAFDQFRKSPELRALHQRLYGNADFDRDTYAAAYQRHIARIARHFAGRRDRVLELNICAGEGWPNLAAFLNAPTPVIPFPHERAPGGKGRTR